MLSDNNSSEKLKLIGIKLKNYRSYHIFPEDNHFLKIGQFTTFVGKNDVGKSNILKAIDTVLNDNGLQIEDFHKEKKECEIILRFKVPKNIKKDLKKIINEYNGDEKIEIKVIFQYDEKTTRKIKGKFFVNNSEKRLTYKALQNFFPQILYIPAVKYVEDELKFAKDSIISKLILPIIEKTSEKKKNQIHTISSLKKKLSAEIQRETNEIRESLKIELSKIWDDVEKIEIEIPDLKLEKAFNPNVKIRDKYTKKDIPISYRGSGMQRSFILAMLEIYRQMKIGKDYIFIIEEPEIFLHIGAQKKMCKILNDLSKEGQIIISTHSHIFVDKLDLSYTYLLYKTKGETHLRRFEGSQEIFEELGISPSDFFLTNGIIFVEGPSDVIILKIFAEGIFKEWDEYNIVIVPIGGSNVENSDPKILLQINPNINFILDSNVQNNSSELPTEKQNLKSKFEQFDISVYFWKKKDKYIREIENFFTKEASEYALNIHLNSEIGLYEDIPLKLSRALFKRRNDYNPNDPSNENIIIRYHKEGKLYNKIRHGRKIAKKMVELNQIPNDVKNILEQVMHNFGIDIQNRPIKI
ncbi:MAG: ATP-dependent nuclease [Promethearchaeia archaeon]